ncbi:hypothetical protein DFJ73DRAFT_384484 [Zopfochytrium polystomum]|nr:hypothetical protein DFJ73DRAFT_384484 [Zopfochytrium polystomum]
MRPTEAQLRQSQSELSAVSFELRELSLTLSVSLQSKIERKSSENALWALPDFVVATLTSTQTLKAIATAFPLLSEFAEDCHSESEPIMKYSFGYNKIAEKGTSVQEKFLLFSLAVRRLLSEVSVCPEEQVVHQVLPSAMMLINPRDKPDRT